MYLRLSYPADLDLLLLRGRLGTRFAEFARKCMKSCLGGPEFSYSPPSFTERDLKRAGRSCLVNIPLDSKRDSEIVSFMSRIPEGARGGIARKMICGCCTSFPSDVFLSIAGEEGLEPANDAGGNRAGGIRKPPRPAKEAEARDAERPVPEAAEPAMAHGVRSEEIERSHAGRPEDEFGGESGENPERRIAAQSSGTKAHGSESGSDGGEAASDEDMMSILAGIVNHR